MLPTILLFATVATLANTFPTLTHPTPFNYISSHTTSSTKQTSGRIASKLTPAQRDPGGVTLCSEPEYAGSCWHGVYPFHTCVALNDYSGHVLSFRPDNGTQCFLMQGQCDAEADYADLQRDTALDDDLSGLPWIQNATSYFCFKPIVINSTRLDG